MTKMFKKAVACVVASALMIGFAPITGFQETEIMAHAASVSELKSKFPAGSYWNHEGSSTNNPDGVTWSPCTHHNPKKGYCSSNGYTGWCGCNAFDGAIQCFGFANKLGYDAFGTKPSSWGKHYDLNSVKPGDIIRYKSDKHSIFVTDVNGDTITYADCNSDGHCIIRWDQTISKGNVYGFTYVLSAPSPLPPENPDIWEEESGWDLSGTFYPVNTSGNTIVYYYQAGPEPNRFISPGDACTIDKVYVSQKDGTRYVHVNYPSSAEESGYRWSYARFDSFNISRPNLDVWEEESGWDLSGIFYPVNSSGNTPVYSFQGGQESNRYISPGDACEIDKVYINKADGVRYVHVKYPSSAEKSGYRWAYARFDAFSISKLIEEVWVEEDGWDLSGQFLPVDTSNNTPLYKFQGGQESNRYISPGDVCNIDKVYVSQNDGTRYVHVKYPSIAEESGYRWSYARFDAFTIKRVDDWTSHIANIGDDVKALIMNADSSNDPWKPICRDQNNVVLGSERSDNFDCTLWHLIRNSDDGSYIIYSYKDGLCLDADGSSGEYPNGVNVQAWESNKTQNQKWYLIDKGDGTFGFRPKCAPEMAMDVNGGYSDDGTNIQLWTPNNSKAQSFKLYSMDAERDQINYTISAEKDTVKNDDQITVTVGGKLPYVLNYKFHIIDPDGNEEIINNGCNTKYTFTAFSIGKYTIFAEVKNPVNSQCGSKTEKAVTVTVNCNHEYVEKVINPTCKDKGYTIHTCAICGNEYKDNETDKLAHDYHAKVIKEATYDEEGIQKYECSVCGDSYTESIPKLVKPETTPVEDTTSTTDETNATTTTLPAESSTTEPITPKRTPGDVNDDGQVNLKDVVLLSRFIAGGMGVTINESAADVNVDGMINLKDVVLIRRYIVGGWNVTLK